MWKKLRKKIAALFEKETEPIYQIPKFISEDNILTLTNRDWYIGKRKLSKDQVSILRGEAKEFGDSFLWKLMRQDIHYLAYLQATAKRHTEMDAVYAGAMYRALEILEEFIKRAQKL